MISLRRIFLLSLALLATAFGPALHGQVNPPTEDAVNQRNALVANTNMTHAMAGAYTSAFKVMGVTDGHGAMKTFNDLKTAYNNTGAPFLDGQLNVGLSRVLANPGFKIIYWSAALLFAGFASVMAMKKAMGGANPLGDLATLAIKLLFGSVLVASRGIIYALLITLMSTMTLALKEAREAGVAPAALDVGLPAADFPRARMEAIQSKGVALAGALEAMGNEKTNAKPLKALYTFLKDGLAPQFPGVVLPPVELADEANTIKNAANLGAWMRANVPTLVSQLESIPRGATVTASGGGVSASLPSLKDSTPLADAVMATPAVGNGVDSSTQHKAQLETYKNLLASELDGYVSTNIDPLLAQALATGGDQSFIDSVAAGFRSLYRAAQHFEEEVRNTLSVTGMMTGAIDAFVKLLGYVQVIMASVITFVAIILIEAQLFVMALMFPFWLNPKTEKAFIAPIRAAVGAALWLPAFTLIMMIVDGLYGGLLKAVFIGGTTGLVGAIGESGATAALAVGVVQAGGVMFLLLVLAFALIYFGITLTTALKSPGWVKMAMEGADVAGDFLMKQATTMAEGAMLAGTIGVGLATAGVGLAAGGAAAAGAAGAGAGAAGAGAGAAGAGAGAGAGAAAGAGNAAAGAGALASEGGGTAAAVSRAPSAAAPMEAAGGPMEAPQLTSPSGSDTGTGGMSEVLDSNGRSMQFDVGQSREVPANEEARSNMAPAASAQPEAQASAPAQSAAQSTAPSQAPAKPKRDYRPLGKFLANTVKATYRSSRNIVESDSVGQWIKNREGQRDRDAKIREMEEAAAAREENAKPAAPSRN